MAAETADFLRDMASDMYDPTCPKCNHRARSHRFGVRNQYGVMTTQVCQAFIDDTERRDSSGYLRLEAKSCDCTLRPDEVRINRADKSRVKLRDLDRAADEQFKKHQSETASTMTEAVVTVTETEAIIAPPAKSEHPDGDGGYGGDYWSTDFFGGMILDEGDFQI